MLKAKSILIISLTALLILALGAPGAMAQEGDNLRLENSDPGTVMAIRVSPLDANTVYVAARLAGVLKTTDNGATWYAKNAGLPTKRIIDLAVNPVTPANLYIATTRGAFRSTDAGETWIAMDLGQENLVCAALALHPQTPGTVFLASAVSGVFGSVDYGQTWVSIGGQEIGQINAMAVTTQSQEQAQGMGALEFSPTTVWAVTEDGVLSRSFEFLTDRVQWRQTELSKEWIYSLIANANIDKKNDIYVGMYKDGIYTSADEGETWVKVPTPDEKANINGLALAPVPAPSVGPDSSSSAEDTAEPALYAASFDGYVMKGVQEGETWTWINVLDASILGVEAVRFKVVTTVGIYGEDGALQTPVPLWVGAFSFVEDGSPINSAVYYSADGGATWATTLAEGWWVAD